MSVKTEKPKKVKKPVDKETKIARTIILISFIIVLIPCIVLGVILINASKGNNTPANGSRFQGDLNPAITESHISSLEKNIKGMSGVENVEINLETATLRILVDAVNSSSKGDIEKLTNNVYDTVTNSLSVETYFSNTTSKRMYDLNIYVYNKLDNDDGNQICYEIVKNATGQEKTSRYVIDPDYKASEE